MTFTPEFLLQVIIALASAGGVYAAIRADLARLHAKAAAASQRMDDHLKSHV